MPVKARQGQAFRKEAESDSPGDNPHLEESPVEPVIARRLCLNKVHDLSATQARVPRHRCAAERG